MHHLYETTEQFEGDMVDSVENVADYMMKMALCARYRVVLHAYMIIIIVNM